MKSRLGLTRFVLSTLVFLIKVILACGIPRANYTYAQDSRMSLDMTCAVAELDKKDGEEVDGILAKIDSLRNTADLAAAIQDLLIRTQGELDYCDIERRLRKMNAQTRLLALPLENVTHPTNQISLFYSQPRFETWSRIPRFAIWYERKGESAALAKLRDAGIDPSENLHNLNVTGVLAIAASIHKSYFIAEKEDRSELNLRYKWIYDDLDNYRISGYLDDHYDSALMFAADNYTESQPGLKYSINDRFTSHTLQFFVIDKDPDRLMAGKSCNCSYVPKTNLILCDKRLLDALSNWVVYQGGRVGTPAILSVSNEMFSGFLLHWLIGHEIGHFVHKDDYEAGFVPLESLDNGSRRTHSANGVQGFEASADSFAIDHMPSNARAGAHMTVNYIIQQLFQDARANAGIRKDGKAEIVLRNPPDGHPNLLSRVFVLKDSLGVVDFLLEDIQKQVTFNQDVGGEFPTVCSLAAEAQGKVGPSK